MPNQIRQLAAIMFTDIAGYTSLMGKDEQKALEILRKNRKTHQTLIHKYGGKWLKEMGDGTLASFNTISDAVYCAGEIMRSSRESDIALRIGIHQGEIVEEAGDIFGDGVNVASRIEPLAKPGQILVSGQVHRNIKNKPGIKSTFIENFDLKNVEGAVDIYAVDISEYPGIPPFTLKNNPGSKRKNKRSVPWAIIVVLMGLLFVILRYSSLLDLFPIGQDKTEFSSIAVLAFDDLSPQGNQEYLGDGIAEEIINVLTRIDGLKVIGRTSSFSFKNQNIDLITIGEKLGVTAILEGSVRKSNNTIRVTAQLIDANDGSHLWSETYDRDMDDLLKIQDDISKEIARKFKMTLDLSREEKPTTDNIEAYELYLEGLYYELKGIQGTLKAIELYKEAIAVDPNFARAYAKLSEVYWEMLIYGLGTREEYYPKIVEASRISLDLDPDEIAGYLMLAWVSITLDWDKQAADAYFNKAIEKGMEENHMNYLEYLFLLETSYERKNQLIDQALEAIKKDPYSVENLAWLSRLYLGTKRYNDVIKNGEQVLSIYPDNSSIFRHMGYAYLYMGDLQKAFDKFRHLIEIDSTYSPQGYIGTLVKMERHAEARTFLEKVSPNISPTKKGLCYIHLEELDSAFHYLEKARIEKDMYLIFLQLDPDYDKIREDPRFKSLTKEIGLWEE